MKATESWFSRGKAKADKGIPHGDRVVGIALVVISVLMGLYFIAHQTRPTGLFTEAFGTAEALMLYGSLVFWVVSAGLEGILGRRLLSRLVEVFGGLILATFATAWLLAVFPFEFANFADVLPESLRFLVQWISNDIARVLMVLGVVVYLGAAAYCPIAYGFVDKRRFKRKKASD